MLGALSVGMAGPVERVAEQNESAWRFLCRQQTCDPAAEGMATDDGMPKVGHLAPIGVDRPLGFANGKRNASRIKSATDESIEVRLHGRDAAGSAVGEVDQGRASRNR